MKGDPEFFILKPWAWMDTAESEKSILGTVVENFASPTDVYAPSDPKKPAPLDAYNAHPLKELKFDDFILSKDASGAQAATAALKSLAHATFAGSVDGAIHLNGKLITCKRLQHVDQFWDKLKDDAEVKTRVRNWVKPGKKPPVCLVVGVMICEDVDVSWTGEEKREVEGGAEVPLHKIMMAAGAPNPLGDSADPQVRASDKQRIVTVFKAKSGESKIFALSLKVVSKKGILRRKLYLKRDGPAVEEGRKAGLSDDEDEDERSDDEDLVLDETAATIQD